jgi:hypothetical protein
MNVYNITEALIPKRVIASYTEEQRSALKEFITQRLQDILNKPQPITKAGQPVISLGKENVYAELSKVLSDKQTAKLLQEQTTITADELITALKEHVSKMKSYEYLQDAANTEYKIAPIVHDNDIWVKKGKDAMDLPIDDIYDALMMQGKYSGPVRTFAGTIPFEKKSDRAKRQAVMDEKYEQDLKAYTVPDVPLMIINEDLSKYDSLYAAQTARLNAIKAGYLDILQPSTEATQTTSQQEITQKIEEEAPTMTKEQLNQLKAAAATLIAQHLESDKKLLAAGEHQVLRSDMFIKAFNKIVRGKGAEIHQLFNKSIYQFNKTGKQSSIGYWDLTPTQKGESD